MDPITFNTTIETMAKVMYTIAVVPQEIVDKTDGLGSRFLCSVNGHPRFHCGMVAYGDGKGYIILNKKKLKQFDLKVGDEAELTLEPDHSKYGMEVPEELQELLEQDDEGREFFENLSDGKKRYIIHYVSSVKSSQLKIDRAIMLINNLKTMPRDKFDYRHLLGMPPREE